MFYASPTQADKLYRQDLATLNIIKRLDSNKELEKNYDKSLLRNLLLNNSKFTANSVDKIDIQTILKMTPEDCRRHQEKVSKKETPTEYDKLVMEFTINN